MILHFYFEVEVVRVHLFLMEREGVSQVDVKMSAKVTRVESINIGPLCICDGIEACSLAIQPG